MQRTELLQPTGPYIVGTHKIDLMDPYRITADYPSGQLIPLLVYFPTQIGEHTSHPKIFEERVPKVFPDLECRVFSQPQSLSEMLPGQHPVVFFNHGHHAAMTDYACILEDLASHGYIVIAMQSQLSTDPNKAPWSHHSISKYARILDDNLCAFNWLKDKQSSLFEGKVDTRKIALIGHSMGGNALMFLAHRTSSMFRPGRNSLLPHEGEHDVKECIVVLDSGFAPPPIIQTPVLFCLAEERETYQEAEGTLESLDQSKYRYSHYSGSKHTSFMDHGWVLDTYMDNPDVSTFNGDLEERRAFYTKLRKDIRDFMAECGVV